MGWHCTRTGTVKYRRPGKLWTWGRTARVVRSLPDVDGWEQVVWANVILNGVLLRLEGAKEFERRISDKSLDPSYRKTVSNALAALARLAELAAENFDDAMDAAGWRPKLAIVPEEPAEAI